LEEQSVYTYLLILSGRAYAAGGDFKKAEDQLHEASKQAELLAASEELMGLLPLVKAESALGAIYTSQHRMEDARLCYKRVNDLWQHFPDDSEYVTRQRKASMSLLAALTK